MRTIALCYPGRSTMPISVTGKYCGLSCRHCGGIYLKSMKQLPDKSEIPPEIKSFLISGGCDRNGIVPLKQHADRLILLKNAGYRLNLHTGLADDETAELAGKIASTVSFDFVTDDRTISTVYDNGRTGGDYREALLRLRKRVDVAPHVTVGLLGGEIQGEFDAVRTLASMEPFRRIVFIVFIPTRGTHYQEAHPPNLNRTAELFDTARRLMPDTSFSLGCMRPRGQYGEKLQMLALDNGFDLIVNPSRRFTDYLCKNGFQINIREECCALD